MGTRLVNGTIFTCALLFASSVAGFEPLPRSTPGERQMDATDLSRAFVAMQDLGYVKGMVVVRDGYVVGEQHWLGPDTTLRDMRSVTKSVISILIGIAIEQGFIERVNDPLVKYLPPDLIPGDPAKHQITLGHLLTQTSGFEWNEDTEVVPWLSSSTPTEDILNKPMAAEPGARWNYNTAATHLLSVAITEATGMRTIEYADANLFVPLGITDRSWILAGNYENGGAGLALRTEDAAKLGVLFIDGGVYSGEQVVSRYWVNRTTYPDVHGIGRFGPLTDIQYGWLWWVDYGTDYNVYTAWGWGGQFVFCVPALKLVVAVNAPWGVNGTVANQHEAAILDIIVDRILPATHDRRVLTTTGQDVVELASVDTMMEDFLRDYEIQGATAALVKDGRLVMARGYTLDEPEVAPLKPTALFRIGSIAKSITSVAIHQLIEDGDLAYDTTVQSVLDLHPLPGETTDPLLDTITVDHLLTHTSGLYSEDNIYLINDLVSEATGEDSPPSQEEIVSYIVSHPFAFSPESNWDYNNYGYMMLDMLLEQATGLGFVDYLQKNIFRPIGVARARQAHQLNIELAPTELSYNGLEGDPYRSPLEAGPSAGGLVMAAPDIARFVSVLFDRPNGDDLLTEETTQSMLELPFLVNEIVGVGRGWFTERFIDLIGVSLGSLADLDDGLPSYGNGGGGSGIHTFAIWRGDNTVFVMFSNHDPVADEIIFPTIDVWPEHDLWATVGVSTDPVGPASTESWIPVVARASGVGGSAWRSDVGLLNRSILDNSIRLRHYQGDGSTDLELVLAPGAQSILSDVLEQLGLEGAGPLRVFSSEPLTVTSRTYNQSGDGTFGQFLPGVASEKSLSTGASVVLMQLQENDQARTNIGLTNGWKRDAQVEISLFDGAGAAVATIERTVPPEQTMQLNRPFFAQGGRMDIDAGYAVVSAQSAEILFAYASVIDNGSGDPTTIPAKLAPGAAHQWVAATAHAAGANNSQWRTDVAVLNLAGDEAAVELRFHGDEGEITTRSLTVTNDQQEVLTDVLDWLGQDGGGALEVVSEQPVLVTSRTYNLGDTGSFGQFLNGEPAAAAADLGDLRWLPQLSQNTAFRTNIGLLNTSGSEARVRIRLYDGDGAELAVMGPTLSPGERRQLQEPFMHIAGRTDINAGYVTVEVREGDGVFCYASVIDNTTNDPTTIPALE